MSLQTWNCNSTAESTFPSQILHDNLWNVRALQIWNSENWDLHNGAKFVDFGELFSMYNSSLRSASTQPRMGRIQTGFCVRVGGVIPDAVGAAMYCCALGVAQGTALHALRTLQLMSRQPKWLPTNRRPYSKEQHPSWCNTTQQNKQPSEGILENSWTMLQSSDTQISTRPRCFIMYSQLSYILFSSFSISLSAANSSS